MDISKRIASIREAKGFTQKQVADIFDMEQSNYSRLEKRGNKLTVEQLEKIAGVLGVSVVELLTGEAQKVEDSGRVKELEKRVEELEKTINLYEILQETSKNQIHLLAEILLKCFLYLIYTEEISTLIGNYFKYKDKDIERLESDLEYFLRDLREVNRLSDKEIESAILHSSMPLVTFSGLMLKLLSLGENNRGVFSKKIHEHFGNEYQRYLEILAMQPDILTFIDKSKEDED